MSQGLPILTYHDFNRRESVLSTDPSRFADDMAALHAAGYRTVNLESWILAGRPLLDRRFALTFDDGLRSILDVAEILARFEFRATAFVVTAHMGKDNRWSGQPSWVPVRPLLSWSDLPRLCASGISVASHTRTHPDLRTVDEQRLREELRGSRLEVEDRTGVPCTLLAYPYGAENERVRRFVAGEFRGAFGTRLRLACALESCQSHSRVDAYYLRSPGAIDDLIAGRLESRLVLRRAARRVRAVCVESWTTVANWRTKPGAG